MYYHSDRLYDYEVIDIPMRYNHATLLSNDKAFKFKILNHYNRQKKDPLFKKMYLSSTGLNQGGLG